MCTPVFFTPFMWRGLFTLFVVPSIYVLVARTHRAEVVEERGAEVAAEPEAAAAM